MFKSKYKRPENLADKLSALQARFPLGEAYVEFLKKYNVVDFGDGFGIKINGDFLSVDRIFGFSPKEDEDALKMNDSYAHRLPENYFAIAAVNESDLLCLRRDGRVCYWNHEVNDLYFNENGSGYKKQNTKLTISARSFDLFLKSIEKRQEDEYNEEEDEYNNPAIPFPDSSLEDDFKHPENFFKNPARLLPIYLKKLELSERGRELIKIFKEKGLL